MLLLTLKNSIFLSIPGSENGEGNGNLLQCSCLENPRDGGAWWVAVYGDAKSWTRLKRLSSSIAYFKIPTPKLFHCILMTIFILLK